MWWRHRPSNIYYIFTQKNLQILSRSRQAYLRGTDVKKRIATTRTWRYLSQYGILSELRFQRQSDPDDRSWRSELSPTPSRSPIRLIGFKPRLLERFRLICHKIRIEYAKCRFLSERHLVSASAASWRTVLDIAEARRRTAERLAITRRRFSGKLSTHIMLHLHHFEGPEQDGELRVSCRIESSVSRQQATAETTLSRHERSISTPCAHSREPRASQPIVSHPHTALD